jgi:hypothetical protein
MALLAAGLDRFPPGGRLLLFGDRDAGSEHRAASSGGRDRGDGEVGDVAVYPGEPCFGGVGSGLAGGWAGVARAEDRQVGVIPPAAGRPPVTGADQVDLVPGVGAGEEVGEAGEPAGALRQPHGHDQRAAGQPGVDDRERASVVRPRLLQGLRGAQVAGLSEHGRVRWEGGGPGVGQARDGPVGVEVTLQGARQPVGLPRGSGLGMGPGAARDGGELRPLARVRLAEPAAGPVGE